MRHTALLTATLIAMSACAAPSVAANYSPLPGFAKAKSDPRFEHPKGDPAVYAASDDPDTDLRRLGEDGYVLMGTGTFPAASSEVLNERARAQAKSVGATVVLIHAAPKDSTPVPAPTPPVRQTGPLTTYGAGATDTGGGSDTGHAADGAARYGMAGSRDPAAVTATFWIRQNISQIHFGANTVPLPEAVRAKLQGRTGVYVQSVIKGTPAFEGGIRAGDVILGISGLEVVDSTNFKDQIEMLAGLSVNVDLARDGKFKTVIVYMRP
jgi:PDZ domain-containing protein